MKIGKIIGGQFLENRYSSDLKVTFSENRVDFKSPANDPKCKSKVQKGLQSSQGAFRRAQKEIWSMAILLLEAKKDNFDQI